MIRSCAARTIRIALALALIPTAAQAIQPPQDRPTVDVEPARVRTYDAALQALLARQDAWQDFARGEGAGWQARFDEKSRTPHRMWGKGIALGDKLDHDSVVSALVDLVERQRELFGVVDDEVVLKSAAHVPEKDAWYVDLDLLVQGLPVYRSGLTFRVAQGRLVMAGVDTYPETPVTGALTLSQDAAITRAIVQGPAPLADHRDLAVTGMLLPREVGGKLELRAVWQVESRTAAPLGRWVSFVDGETGELLNVHDTIRWFDGTLLAEHDNRLGAGGVEVSPLPYARVSGGGRTVFTGPVGTWTLPTVASYTVSLAGARSTVRDEQGTVTPSIGQITPATLTSANFGNRRAALSTYVWTERAQRWGVQYAPGVSWSDGPTTAIVNIAGSCNAYFDGNINFLQAGGGCRNTGQQADVIVHEWGHGFHYYSLQSGSFDGSLSEGAADFNAALLSGDSRIAPGFFSGGGSLRNLDNNARWPDSFVNNADYVHSNGQIFGGAMWDTWQALRRDLGDAAAFEVASDLFTGILRGGPDIEASYDEAVFVDDDDGNLANGTPHLCQIQEGFGRHGLGPSGGTGLSVDHEPLINPAAGQPVRVTAQIVEPGAACGGGTAAVSGAVWYRVNEGSWRWANMSVANGEASVDLPAFGLGDIVSYYVDLSAPGNTLVSSPSTGRVRPHTFFVGETLTIGCTNLESNPAGFTSALIDGTATQGADDWQWGVPGGKGGDPSRAFSGTRVWGNDLGPDGYNGEYQDNKQNRLTSPIAWLGHYEDVFVHYRRWLTVEDATYDQARILVDGVPVWTNWSSAAGDQHHIDDAWASHAVRVGPEADDRQIIVSWEIDSDGGLTFGGWTLDDLCLRAPATADNRLGITDLRVTLGTAGGEWRFTVPRFGPVEEVRVVRTTNRFPTGPQDGELVWSQTGPVPGAVASGTYLPPAGQRRGVHLAAYAFDGTDWLSWTIPGANAVRLGQ